MLSNKFATVNLKERELIRQYREQNPSSLAFKNPDQSQPLELLLLEFKLEKLIQACNMTIGKRESTWSQTGQKTFDLESLKESFPEFDWKQFDVPKGSMINLTKPILPAANKKARLKSLLEYRQERKDSVESVLNSVPVPVPLLSCFQAEVIKDDVESSGVHELEISSLHSLLVDFFERRKNNLINAKKKSIQRWNRFATAHSSLNNAFEFFNLRLSSIEDEYIHATKVTERLKAALSFKASSEVPIKDDDVLYGRSIEHQDMAIYIRWLICHMKSVKSLERFFQRVQWVLYSHRFTIYQRIANLIKDVNVTSYFPESSEFGSMFSNNFSTPQSSTHLAPNPNAPANGEKIVEPPKPSLGSILTSNGCPRMAVDNFQLMVLLEKLKAHYKLDCDIDWNEGKDLLSQANKTFMNEFIKQAADRFFPVYDASAYTSALGGKFKLSTPRTMTATSAVSQEITANTVHLKQVDWVQNLEPVLDESHLKQAQQLSKLKNIDNLLRVELSFLAVDDFTFAVQRLNDNAQTHNHRAANTISEVVKLSQQFFQDKQADNTDKVKDKKLTRNVSEMTAASFMSDGSDDEEEEDQGYPSIGSAKLQAYYFLRHIRTRSHRLKLLYLLNYFKSLEKRLSIDLNEGVPSKPAWPRKTKKSKRKSEPQEDQESEESAQSDSESEGELAANEPYPAASPNQSLKNQFDQYEFGLPETPKGDRPGLLKTKDQLGIYIMYDGALQDLEQLETELLKIGTHYISRERNTRPLVDRQSLLEDLFEHEYLFQNSKLKLLQCYMEIYEHIVDSQQQRQTAQLICNFIHLRPLLDFEDAYFTNSYKIHTKCLEAHANLIRELVNHHISCQTFIMQLHKDERLDPEDKFGYPLPIFMPQPMQGFSTATSQLPLQFYDESQFIGLLDFHDTLGGVNSFDALHKYHLTEFIKLYQPKCTLLVNFISLALMHQYIDELKIVKDNKYVFEIEQGGGGGLLDDAVYMDSFIQELLLPIQTASSNAGPLKENFPLLRRFQRANTLSKVPSRNSSSSEVRPNTSFLSNLSSNNNGGKNVGVRFADLPAGSTPPPKIFKRNTSFTSILTEIAKKSEHEISSTEDDRVLRMAEAYMNIIDALTLRKKLFDALYETGIVWNVYKFQARSGKQDINKLSFEVVNMQEATANYAQRISLPASLEIDLFPQGVAYSELAIYSLDASLAKFDFYSPAGIKALLSHHGLDQLRKAFHLQVLRKDSLIVAVQYNQLVLDAFMCQQNVRPQDVISQGKTFLTEKKLMFQEKEKEKEKKAPRNIFQYANARTGFGFMDEAVKNEEKQQFPDVQETDRYFLFLNKLMQPMRDNLTKQYREQLEAVVESFKSENAELLPIEIRQLKYQLVESYIKDVMSEIYSYSLRIQISRVSEQIIAHLHSIPQSDKLLFLIGKPPAAPTVAVFGTSLEPFLAPTEAPQQPVAPALSPREGSTSARRARSPLEKKKESKFKSKDIHTAPEKMEVLVGQDGRIKNIWFLPHTKEVMLLLQGEALITQIRGLSVALKVMLAMHDILVFLITQNMMSQASQSSASLDGLILELNIIQNELTVLNNNRTSTEEILLFLIRKRESLFLKFALAMFNLHEHFMNEDLFQDAHSLEKKLRQFLIAQDTKNYPSPLPPPSPSPPSNIYDLFLDDRPNVIAASKHTGMFVGYHLPEIYHHVSLCISELTDTFLNYGTSQMLAIDLLVEDLFSENNMFPASQPLEALTLQNAFLHSSLQIIQLKRLYLFLLFGITEVTNKKDWKEAERAYQANILNKTINKLTEASTGSKLLTESESDSLKDVLGGGSKEPQQNQSKGWKLLRQKVAEEKEKKAKTSLSNLVQAAKAQHKRRQKFKQARLPASLKSGAVKIPESTLRKRLIVTLKHEVNKLILTKFCNDVAAIQSLLLADWNNKVTQQDNTDNSLVERVDFMEEFVNLLLSRATVSMEPGGETTCRFSATHLNHCLDLFATKLAEWGVEKQEERDQSFQQHIEHLTHLVELKEQNIKHLQYMRDLDEKNLGRKIEVEIADKGLDLIVEINSCYRQLHEMKVKLDNTEKIVREKVRAEYEDVVKELSMKLITSTNTYEQNRVDVYHNMVSQLSTIKVDALKKVMQTGTGQHKQYVAELIALESKITNLKLENLDLQKKLLKLKSMQKLKDVALRTHYEKRIRQMEEGYSRANKTIGESREAIEQRETILRKQLVTTQNGLSKCEVQIAELKKELENQYRNKEELVHWKVAKSKILAELQSKSQQFERWSHINLDKLILDSKKKDEELNKLKFSENSYQKKIEMVEERKDKEIKDLQKQIQEEKKLKQSLMKNLEQAEQEKSQLQTENQYLAQLLKDNGLEGNPPPQRTSRPSSATFQRTSSSTTLRSTPLATTPDDSTNDLFANLVPTAEPKSEKDANQPTAVLHSKMFRNASPSGSLSNLTKAVARSARINWEIGK